MSEIANEGTGTETVLVSGGKFRELLSEIADPSKIFSIEWMGDRVPEGVRAVEIQETDLADFDPAYMWVDGDRLCLASPASVALLHENCDGMFEGMHSLAYISGLAHLDARYTASMADMFRGTGIDDLEPISKWGVFRVQDMSGMFADCDYIRDLAPIAGWDTQDVEDMSEMFCGCIRLEDLSPLAGWDVSSVADMSRMFCWCESLKELSAVGQWRTPSLTDMYGMFEGCKSLTDISPIADMDVENVRDVCSLFYDCNAVADFSPLAKWQFRDESVGIPLKGVIEMSLKAGQQGEGQANEPEKPKHKHKGRGM